MSEAELARNLAAVLARVRQGEEVVIEQDDRPVAVLKPSVLAAPGRKLTECIALAKAWEVRLGYAPVPDEDFAKDVEAEFRRVTMPSNRPHGISPRLQRPVSQLLASLSKAVAETQFLLSSITWMELEHGYYRAANPELAARRRAWLDELLPAAPVEPLTREMSALAAKVDAQMKARGVVIATADLLIGATALYYSYSVGTRNIRHFQLIPDLHVIPL